MNWLISSSMKIRPASDANVLVIALITSTLILIVFAPEAVADAGDQEDQRDDEDQAVHERRVADDRVGLRVAQRRARAAASAARSTTIEREHAVERVAQPARLVAELGASSAGSSVASAVAAPPSAGSGTYAPSRGSIIRSVTIVIDDRDEERRDDREPEVRGDADRLGSG